MRHRRTLLLFALFIAAEHQRRRNFLAFSKKIPYNPSGFAGGRITNPINPTSPLLYFCKWQTLYEISLMKDLSKDLFNPISGEDFVQMFDKDYGTQETLQGYATKGTVKDIRGDFAMVDVGLKSEGRVPLKEFGASVPSVGDIIDVFVERYESREGTAVLSYTKARAEKAWKDLEKTVAEGVDPEGTIIDVVRGGYTVDLGGVFAFMPSSQVDHKPVRDAKSLIGLKDKFRVLKMDALRTNAIVSRRAIQSDSIAAAQREAMKNITLGAVIEGTVKNITDYGVFVDLGGVDGLLHVTDLSWKRVNHPRELVHVGEKIKVKVIQFVGCETIGSRPMGYSVPRIQCWRHSIGQGFVHHRLRRIH